MPVKPLSPGRHLLPAFSLMIGLMPVPAAAFLHASETDTDSGRALYVEHCAACHGVDLEGQPDWRSPTPTASIRRRPMTRRVTPGITMTPCSSTTSPEAVRPSWTTWT